MLRGGSGANARPGTRMGPDACRHRPHTKFTGLDPSGPRVRSDGDLRGLGRDFGDLAEGVDIADREVGERLAVEFDPGGLHSLHEAGVREAVHPGRRVDPRDPEGPEVGLLLLAVAVGVRHAALDVLLRRLVQLAAGLEAALGGLHDLLLARVMRDPALDAWHR